MFGVGLRGAAIFLPAEYVAILRRRRARRNLAIANAFPLILPLIPQSVARLLHAGARRKILPHVSAVLLIQCGPRIGNALPVIRIVSPGRTPVNVRQVRGIEIVLMDERVIHNHPAFAPTGMPAPAAPSVPAASEEQTNVDAASEAEIQAAALSGLPVCVR